MLKVDLATLGEGGAVEAFDFGLKEVLANIVDVNTPCEKAREVMLVVKIKPNKHRNKISMEYQVKTKLLPAEATVVDAHLDNDENGELAAFELNFKGHNPNQHTLPVEAEQEDEGFVAGEKQSNVTPIAAVR